MNKSIHFEGNVSEKDQKGSISILPRSRAVKKEEKKARGEYSLIVIDIFISGEKITIYFFS